MTSANTAKRSMIHKAMLISLALPAATCNIVQLKKPQIMPWVME